MIFPGPLTGMVKKDGSTGQGKGLNKLSDEILSCQETIKQTNR